ncbi:MAG: hypothetical protein OXR84_12310, partial [Magnetovibrio sp.]|nr:hypothetical protein [Magnetovibrio sp.]
VEIENCSAYVPIMLNPTGTEEMRMNVQPEARMRLHIRKLGHSKRLIKLVKFRGNPEMSSLGKGCV